MKASNLQIGNKRHFVREAVEIVWHQGNAGAAGHRDPLDHGVGQASDCYLDRKCVFEALANDEAVRRQMLTDLLGNTLAGGAMRGLRIAFDAEL
jgi:hypothetical protein